jgi:flavin reductase (DIM6/NTAB) family NADH-FMN oxidoreductase RutF
MFTTGVALITTAGSKGPNVMAAEWTFNVSYNPFLISVHIEEGEATHAAIVETGEFGVSMCAEEQVVAMAFAGHFTGSETDKISSDAFETIPATKIKAPLIRGSLFTAECRVVQRVEMGDHTAFVGEVVAFSAEAERKPVVLHRGAHHLGPRIDRGTKVAVAVTPSKAAPGSTLTVDGELSAPERGMKEILIALRGRDGIEIARAAAQTDRGGFFSATLQLPEGLPPGRYAVVARFVEAEGRARLDVR